MQVNLDVVRDLRYQVLCRCVVFLPRDATH